MKDFERNLLKGAFELKEQIIRTKHFLTQTVNDEKVAVDLQNGELRLIWDNFYAMNISYNALMQRIEMRHLTQEYADYTAEHKHDLPF